MTSESKHVRVRVYHDYYGCETGCCGHTVEIKSDDFEQQRFEFAHPWGENDKEWARELAEEVIGKYWPECLSSIDWDSLEVDVLDE